MLSTALLWCDSDPSLQAGKKQLRKLNLPLKIKEMPVIISFVQAIPLPCHLLCTCSHGVYIPGECMLISSLTSIYQNVSPGNPAPYRLVGLQCQGKFMIQGNGLLPQRPGPEFEYQPHNYNLWDLRRDYLSCMSFHSNHKN